MLLVKINKATTNLQKYKRRSQENDKSELRSFERTCRRWETELQSGACGLTMSAIPFCPLTRSESGNERMP